jgi:hypothetical protein
VLKEEVGDFIKAWGLAGGEGIDAGFNFLFIGEGRDVGMAVRDKGHAPAHLRLERGRGRGKGHGGLEVICLDFSFSLLIKDKGFVVEDGWVAGFGISAKGTGGSPKRVVIKRQSGDEIVPLCARIGADLALHLGAQTVVSRPIVGQSAPLPAVAGRVALLDQFHQPRGEVAAIPRCIGNGTRSRLSSR